MWADSRLLDRLPWRRQPSKFPTITIAVAGEEVLAAELPSGRYTIGGSSLSDFCLPMLEEDQLCTLECVIEPERETLVLSNIAPSLFINGKRAQTASQELVLSAPVHLKAEEVNIEIRSQRVVRNYLPLALFAGALLLVAAGWWVGNGPAQVGLAQMPAVETAGSPLMTVEAVSTELKRRIAQTDLAGRLTVHEEATGIVVRGQLPRNLTTLWREQLVNIRQRSRVMVSADIAPIDQEADGRAEIAAVLLEPRRTVIGSDERIRLEGEELLSGWVIETISLKTVRLSRDGLVDEVSLPDVPVQGAGG